MTPATPSQATNQDLRNALGAAIKQVNTVLLGKPREVHLAFTCLLAGGHLLIEDLPGVGKTTLAHALAATLDLSYQRVQFTSDLLPSDIIGVSIYQRESEQFQFHPGPLFTVDGHTHHLDAPFFVVATQNPVDLAGTWPLPDSQLDRFMLRMSLGYPDAAAEHAMLLGPDRRRILDELKPCLSPAQIISLREQCASVHASPALIDYLQLLLAGSRQHPEIRIGLSPRAGLAVLAAARAHALLADRAYVLPEDVQAVFPFVAAHRLTPAAGSRADRDVLANKLLEATPVR